MSSTQPGGIKTFLIADVRGYTRFTQERGDEAAARLATKFADLARATVAAAGGSVIELRGDEALAVFDSARQAIRAAVDLQGQFVEQTVVDPTLPLAVGIGLDAGEAVRVDGGFRGGALNLAARLCSLADPGEVLVSREVAHLARKVEGVTYLERGSIRLKGLAEPVPVITVRRELEDPSQNVAFRRALGPVATAVGDELSTRNPYKGLRAFEEADAADFFGREALSEHLVERLSQTRFLGVVGPSGSGKSSVVRAGLVPALRRGAVEGSEAWRIVQMVPGAYPLEELEAALLRVADMPPSSLIEQLEEGERGLVRALKRVLPDDGSELVLVLDQLEEVFTLVEDERIRTHFLAILERAVTDPHSRVRVVTTLRADFYDRPLLYSGFAELLRDYVEAVVPLTPDEFERAISAPADRVGVTLEPGLLAEMISDVAHEPGALPLLQYSLTELYERREGNVLTRDAYQAVGRVSGALAQRAEDIYSELSEPAQHAARQLFLRLITLGEGAEDTRRRVDRAELGAMEVDQDALAEAIDAFGASRLLSFDRDPRTGTATVEVAHEALLREWARLRRWIDAAREDVRMHRRLAAAARDWAESSREPSYLLRGSQLAQFDVLADESSVALAAGEREFVDASRAESRRQLLRQQRENRRLKVLLGGVAALLLLAVAAGVVALLQRQSAKREATVALARELGARAVAEPRIDRAMLLAREGANLDDSHQTAGTLLATLLRTPAALGTFASPITDRPLGIVLSPDGRTLAAIENTDTVRFYDTRTRKESSPPLRNHGYGQPPAYTRDGKFVLVGGGTGRPSFDLRDAHTLRHLRFLPLDDRWIHTPTSHIEPLLTSPDDRFAYLAYAAIQPDRTDGPAYLDRWDLRTGKLLGTSALGSNGMFDGHITRGGDLVFLTDTEVVTLHGKTLRRLSSKPVRLPEESSTAFAAVSPDGRTVATASMSGSVSFVDVRTGHMTIGAGKTGVGVQALAFSPTGNVVVTTDENGRVTVWNPATADPLETFTGHEGRTLGIAFSADGKTLYTCSLDGAVFEWDLGNQRRFGRPFQAYPQPRDEQAAEHNPLLAVSADGTTFATAPEGSRVALLSLRTLDQERVLDALPKGATVTSIAWSPKGSLLAVGGKGRLRLWDVSGRPRLVRAFVGLKGTVQQTAFSPDGSVIAAVDGDGPPVQESPTGHLAVWRVESGAPLVRPLDLNADGWTALFSPDGKILVAGDGSGKVRVLDSRSVHIVRTLQLTGGTNTSLAFAPDGTLETGSWGGIMQHWNVSTGKQLGNPVLAMPAPVATIAFDPTGEEFATAGGSDGFVKLWDTRTLQQLGSTFPGEPGRWASAAFTPDGGELITLYANGRGTLWPASVRAWKEHACSVAGRSFTREEWSRFVGGRSYSSVCP